MRLSSIKSNPSTVASFRCSFPQAIHSILALGIALAATLSGQYASAKVEYDSNQLRMKNSEEFAKIVKRKIKLATNIQSRQKLDFENGLIAEPEAIAFLTDGLRIVFSRPDQDESVDDLYGTIRHELQDLNSFPDVVRTLVDESVRALKDDETPVQEQGTYLTILNNLISETKPELRIGNELYKSLESIRDAKLKVSDKLKNQMFLRSMSSPVSPSETAKIALKDAKPDTTKSSKSDPKTRENKKINRGKKPTPVDEDTELE